MNKDPRTLIDIIRIFTDLIQLTLPVLAGLSFLAFLWGLLKFIFRIGGDENAVTEGKNLMIWGLVGLTVMVSIYGILRFLSAEFGFPQIGLPLLPI